MTRRGRNLAIGGGLLALGGAVTWLLWPRTAQAATPDDGGGGLKLDAVDAKDSGLHLDATEAKSVDPATLCDLDGKPYDPARYSSPSAVLAALRSLGYSLTSLTSKAGRDQVRLFQNRARALRLDGYDGAPQSYIDGIVGACTLRALADAQERHALGTWPPPYLPLPG